MREIKFRGRSLSGKWFSGDLARPKNDISSNVKGGGSFISNDYGMPHAYPVRPETVGQYTGLKDKNGVEIWEGDVLRTDESDPVWVVSYEAPKFVVTTPRTKTSCALYEDLAHEVIGNVWENPSLLKETAQ